MSLRGAAARPETDVVIALSEELRQWKRALGWWSGLPAQEAFDFYANRRVISDRQQEREDEIDAEFPARPSNTEETTKDA